MENIHDKVVKLTAEILNKSWTSDSGTVSPFSSGSSINDNNINDNHLEYYVQKDPNAPLHGAISDIFNSNLFTNGGEKMTEKTLDVDSSTTPKQQYNNPGTSTTEPDPQSQIAITKMDRPQNSQDEEGKGTYSTTANTTTEAPAAGDTTEPTTKADGKCPDCGKDEADCNCKMEKAESCSDCGKTMNMCMCKRAKCPHCGQSMPDEMNKAKDSDDDKDSEPDNDEDDIKKLEDIAWNYFEKKEFSEARRKQLASAGKAMPDGSFPIENEQDLRNAIQAYGRAKNKDAAKAHIIARAKSLGKTKLLPEDWTKDMKKSMWGNFFLPVD